MNYSLRRSFVSRKRRVTVSFFISALNMMTSWNGNIFRVTGHLCGEFIEFWCFLNKRLSKRSWSWWFDTLWRPLWRQCNEHINKPLFLFPDAHDKSTASTATYIFLASLPYWYHNYLGRWCFHYVTTAGIYVSFSTKYKLRRRHLTQRTVTYISNHHSNKIMS